MVNFYRRLMPNLAAKLHPLHEATKGKDKPITWTGGCDQSFEAAKSALEEATLLHHPDPSSSTSVTVDTFASAIRAKLA